MNLFVVIEACVDYILSYGSYIRTVYTEVCFTEPNTRVLA